MPRRRTGNRAGRERFCIRSHGYGSPMSLVTGNGLSGPRRDRSKFLKASKPRAPLAIVGPQMDRRFRWRERWAPSRWANLELFEGVRTPSRRHKFHGWPRQAPGASNSACCHRGYPQCERFSRRLDVPRDRRQPHVHAMVFQARKRRLLHFRSAGKFGKAQAGLLAMRCEDHADRVLTVVLVEVGPRFRIPRLARGDEFFDVAHKSDSLRV